MSNMSVKIKLPNFEGPFDLLYHLIEKEEVSIYDIPIAKITEQYLVYLEEMLQLDLEVASEFLVMAATLLSIKARMLLPKPPRQSEEVFEEDPRAELVEKLLEYKKYKAASEFLKDKAGQASLSLPHPDESEYFVSLFGEPDLTGVSVVEIGKAFAKILARLDKIEPTVTLKKRVITVGEKMHWLLSLILPERPYAFEELFEYPCTRMEIVITFLAVLELIRLRKVIVRQEKPFEEIFLFKRAEEKGGIISAF